MVDQEIVIAIDELPMYWQRYKVVCCRFVTAFLLLVRCVQYLTIAISRELINIRLETKSCRI